ncbi:T9SS type A sorting domain-containing protein [Flavobacteriaceae bacterium]|nr:T9SS type A sorting domain-containing protein [Flavobacteriaceae bacterium]
MKKTTLLIMLLMSLFGYSQEITVSIDVSADPGGVNIVSPTVSGDWAEYAATVDPNNANIYSYTFAEGVTSAEFVWKVYGTSAGDVQESLAGIVGGGAIENNLAANLPTGNSIITDYSSYCNRKVTSTVNYTAPTFIFNSFRQVGVTYTKLVLTADAGDNIVIDYNLNNWDVNHGPGATDNGDGTYTAIVTPESAFEYMWNNLTDGTNATDGREDLLTCTNGNGINTDNNSYANRVHVAGEDEADTFGACPALPQTITVSIDVSADPGGVNIVSPTVSGDWAEYAATVDPNNANIYSYTFAEGVTSAEFVWKVYGTSAGDVQESLAGIVGGGAIENNLAANLPTGNSIITDYSSYCNRKVTSTVNYTAPTFIFNSFRQVGVTYTKLVLTADAGDNIVIDYNLNNWDVNHGPGATDNGDGTYTAIVTPESAFEYMWNNLTDGTNATDGREDLLTCTNGNGINTDNNSYANRVHVAGEDEADTFGACPATAGVDDNNIINVSIYPNPSSSNWNFRTGNTVITSVEVFNLLGKRVVLQNNNSTNVAISTQGLTSGIYIARITTEQGTKSVKLIKE